MRDHKRSQVVDGVKTVSGLLGKDSLLPGRWCMCGKPRASFFDPKPDNLMLRHFLHDEHAMLRSGVVSHTYNSL